MKFKKLAVAVAAGSMAIAPVWAEDVEAAAEATEEVSVVGVRERLLQKGALKDVIAKTEVLDSGVIESARAVSLTEAMKEAPGVIVANECSMCGYKRIQLNGLKADHTNILNDGLPIHTIVSGFYAVDAIATTGVERIEVARGAGASLTAPEAIGGVINIVTVERAENGGTIDVSAGEEGFRQIGLLGTAVTSDESARFTFAGQFDERDQYDGDSNGVNEDPYMKNESFVARVSWDITERDNVVVRLSSAEQEVFGGPVMGDVTSSIGSAIASESFGEADQLFVGDDVRNDFIGNPWETTEWIETTHVAYSASWLREINDDWNMTLAVSGSSLEQDSFYEGFDYKADNDMLYVDAHFNYILNDQHTLTFGFDNRAEELRSRSAAGEAALIDGDDDTNYVSDSFNYDVTGVYIQDTWAVNDALEIKAAVRFDQVEADFIDPSKPGTEIDETIISPRLDARYIHDDAWTSRFSLGRGYRAPLSFFETDHGLLDAEVGFEVDVDDLERSTSAGYTLSFEGDALTAAASLTHTEISNLAALDETDGGVPLLTQLEEDASVTAFDVNLGYKITESLTANLTLATYDHDDNFQSSFGVATTEEQINASIDWEVSGFDVYVSATWIGSRDLTDYGYEGFNDAAGTSAKPTDAPSFYTVDTRIAYEIGDSWQVYAGANNLLDYTQVEDESSPLMFDTDGGYDVAYIYAPLRGRELYAGVKFEF